MPHTTTGLIEILHFFACVVFESQNVEYHRDRPFGAHYCPQWMDFGHGSLDVRREHPGHEPIENRQDHDQEPTWRPNTANCSLEEGQL